RTQQIIAHESGVADSIDPLGGSYLMEAFTSAMEKEALRYIQRIDDMGGALAAIEQGFIQREIQESSYRYQQSVESAKQVVVGVNRFVSPPPKVAGLLRVDPAAAAAQKQRVAALKAGRDKARVANTLKNLETVAKGKGNTMPAFLDCVEAYATVGEMCDTLRGVFGEQKEFLYF
ncbi:MAG: methylmalonyl-CoA mutase family protein, partial [Chloroflexota bacterium]|nr:methylmalonyl-CoA mutase family protein [Chloroflexota bacterium]